MPFPPPCIVRGRTSSSLLLSFGHPPSPSPLLISLLVSPILVSLILVFSSSRLPPPRVLVAPPCPPSSSPSFLFWDPHAAALQFSFRDTTRCCRPFAHVVVSPCECVCGLVHGCVGWCLGTRLQPASIVHTFSFTLRAPSTPLAPSMPLPSSVSSATASDPPLSNSTSLFPYRDPSRLHAVVFLAHQVPPLSRSTSGVNQAWV